MKEPQEDSFPVKGRSSFEWSGVEGAEARCRGEEGGMEVEAVSAQNSSQIFGSSWR